MSAYFCWTTICEKPRKTKRCTATEYNTIKVVRSQNIVEVTISLQSKGMTHLFDGLRRNVAWNDLLDTIPWYSSAKNDRALAKAKRYAVLKKLQIYNADLSVCESLRYNTHITHLDIYDARMIDNRQFNSFCDMLCANSTITHICIHIVLTDAICQVISTNVTLRSISCKLNDRNILEKMMDAMCTNNTLHTLCLYILQPFTQHICTFIAKMICNNSSLVDLNLGQRDVDDVGRMILENAMQYNSTLNVLLYVSTIADDLFSLRSKCLHARDQTYQLLFCNDFVDMKLYDATILTRVLHYLIIPNDAIPHCWL